MAFTNGFIVVAFFSDNYFDNEPVKLIGYFIEKKLTECRSRSGDRPSRNLSLSSQFAGFWYPAMAFVLSGLKV